MNLLRHPSQRLQFKSHPDSQTFLPRWCSVNTDLGLGKEDFCKMIIDLRGVLCDSGKGGHFDRETSEPLQAQEEKGFSFTRRTPQAKKNRLWGLG